MSSTHSLHRLLRWLAALGLILGVFILGIFGSAYYLSPQDTEVPADAIIVVSGGQTLLRAERGIELYRAGLAPALIFSGASLDDGPSNARQMALEARRQGVPMPAIYTDEVSQTTYQNAVQTKPIIDQLGARRIYLVTSPYHQRRTLMTFQKVYGPNYQFINESSFDSRWSKSAWWATPFGVYITLSELGKIIFLTATGNYQ
ncbi:YdcF family protein [Candidatus Saccharibacteria bacterium]|nr:YdcF family protein [Candidatus Saccharibacteria bacterium]